MREKKNTPFLNDLCTALWYPLLGKADDHGVSKPTMDMMPRELFEDMQIIFFMEGLYVTAESCFPGYGKWFKKGLKATK